MSAEALPPKAARGQHAPVRGVDRVKALILLLALAPFPAAAEAMLFRQACLGGLAPAALGLEIVGRPTQGAIGFASGRPAIIAGDPAGERQWLYRSVDEPYASCIAAEMGTSPQTALAGLSDILAEAQTLGSHPGTPETVLSYDPPADIWRLPDGRFLAIRCPALYGSERPDIALVEIGDPANPDFTWPPAGSRIAEVIAGRADPLPFLCTEPEIRS